MPKAPNHRLIVTEEGKRLRGECACGKWVRTTPKDAQARDRLAARFVDHVTGSNRLA